MSERRFDVQPASNLLPKPITFWNIFYVMLKDKSYRYLLHLIVIICMTVVTVIIIIIINYCTTNRRTRKYFAKYILIFHRENIFFRAGCNKSQFNVCFHLRINGLIFLTFVFKVDLHPPVIT